MQIKAFATRVARRYRILRIQSIQSSILAMPQWGKAKTWTAIMK